MPISSGLLALGGIGKGLTEGVDEYREVKKAQQQKRQQDAAMGLLAAKQGFDYDNSSGLLSPNALGTAQQDAAVSDATFKGAQAKRGTQEIADESNPQSDYGKVSTALSGAQSQWLRKKGYDDLAEELDNAHSPRALDLLADSPRMKQALAGIEKDEGYKNALAVAAERGKATLGAATARQGVTAGRLEETKGQNAARAGQAFETDKVIVPLKKNLNGLQRGEDMLNGKLPLTTSLINAVGQDFINSLTADNSATEGKVNRELVETFTEKWNRFKQKMGDEPDLRKEEPKVVEQLRNMIGEVKGSYANAIGDQALNIHDSYKDHPNAGVREVVKNKLAKYNPKAYAEIYGDQQGPQQGNGGMLKPTPGLLPNGPQPQSSGLSDEDMAALNWASANPKDKRAAEIMQRLGR